MYIYILYIYTYINHITYTYNYTDAPKKKSHSNKLKSPALLPRGQLPVHAPLKRNEGYFFGAPRKRSLCTEKIKAAASRKRRKIKKSKRQMLAKVSHLYLQ